MPAKSLVEKVTKLTAALFVMVDPFTVPVMVAAPVVVAEVSVAVWVPFPLSVTVLNVPKVVDMVTV